MGMAQSKKPNRESRKNVLRILLTETERKALDEAANSETIGTSSWARMQLLQLAKRKASTPDNAVMLQWADNATIPPELDNDDEEERPW
jgi:hypothetical protein